MNLVSIIIPVHPSHNKIDILGACLKSLSAQTFPKQSIEIVIVGDGCAIKEEFCPPDIKCVIYNFTKQVGVLRARNKGFELSHGDLIAFLDADCVTDKKWLGNLIRGLEEESVAGCSGKIVGFNERDVYKDRIYSENYILPCSGMGNIIFKKHVLSETGLFDEKLCFGAEEADLCWRTYLKGYRIKHIPEAVIYHTSVRDIKDFFLYGAAARILAIKYKKILHLSPLPELMRLAKYSGSEQKSKNLTFLFSLIIPYILIAGYFYRAFLEIFRRVTRVSPAADIEEFLSATPLAKLVLTVDSKKTAKPNYIIWWRTENGCIIKDLKLRRDYVMDNISSAMWALIIKGNTREDIIENMIHEYNVERDVLAADFDEFACQLVDSGILKLI